MPEELDIERLEATIRTRYPYPLAATYYRAYSEAGDDPILAHDYLMNLFEVTIRYLTTIALAQYFKDGPDDPKLNSSLLNLQRPSLGHWQGWLRDILDLYSRNRERLLVPELAVFYNQKHSSTVAGAYNSTRQIIRSRAAGAGEERTRSVVTTREFFEILGTYRNRLAHGASIAPHQRERAAGVLGAAFREIYAAMSFVADYRLVFVKEVVVDFDPHQSSVMRFGHRLVYLTGDRPRTLGELQRLSGEALRPKELYLLDKEAGFRPLLNLHPFWVFHRSDNRDAEEAYVLNESNDQALDYISYQSGDHFNPTEYIDQMRSLLSNLKLAAATAKEDEEDVAREEERRRHQQELAAVQAQLEAERRAREETELHARAELERTERELTERQAREDQEQRTRPEEEPRTREAAERKAPMQAEKKAQEELALLARQEEEHRAQAEAAREQADRERPKQVVASTPWIAQGSSAGEERTGGLDAGDLAEQSPAPPEESAGMMPPGGATRRRQGAPLQAGAEPGRPGTGRDGRQAVRVSAALVLAGGLVLVLVLGAGVIAAMVNSNLPKRTPMNGPGLAGGVTPTATQIAPSPTNLEMHATEPSTEAPVADIPHRTATQTPVRSAATATLLVMPSPTAPPEPSETADEVPFSGPAAIAASTSTALAGMSGFADQAFQRVWERTDSPVASGKLTRTYFWGAKPGPAAVELFDDIPSGMRLVQYFDKSRMELNDADNDPSGPFYVTNGLLPVELTSGRLQTGYASWEERYPARINVVGDNDDPDAPTYVSFRTVVGLTAQSGRRDANHMGQAVTATINRAGGVGEDNRKNSVPGVMVAYYEEVTGHNIPEIFWAFLNQSAQVYRDGNLITEQLSTPWFYSTGLPISDAYWARVKIMSVSTDVLVQLFERRVLAYIPSAPSELQVQFTDVGDHYYRWRYQGAGR